MVEVAGKVPTRSTTQGCHLKIQRNSKKRALGKEKVKKEVWEQTVKSEHLKSNLLQGFSTLKKKKSCIRKWVLVTFKRPEKCEQFGENTKKMEFQ